MTAAEPVDAPAGVKIDARGVSVFYGDKQALFDVTLPINDRAVTALIGPSGCGKSTFLRCVNRMNDTIEHCRVTGEIIIDGADVNDPALDPVPLRARVGMVFQKPNPFPKSVYDNIAYGVRIHGLARSRRDMDAVVKTTLTRVGLWDEVADRLDQPATALSGGQQQRLCIARAIAVNPEVILMDEPASALDPGATERVEQLILELQQRYCIIVITHSMAQAKRISQKTAFFHLGRVVEYGATEQVFSEPQRPETRAYVTGKFG